MFHLVSKLEIPCTCCSVWFLSHCSLTTVAQSIARQLQIPLVKPLQLLETWASHHWIVILLIITASKEHGVKCGIAHETKVSSNLGLACFNCVIQDRFSNISKSVFPPFIECNNVFIGLLWNLGLMYKPSRIIFWGRINAVIIYCCSLTI